MALERRSRGIAASCAVRPPAEWTEEMVALLGKIRDTEIARRFDLDPRSVQQKQVTPGIPAPRPAGPGVVSDELVELLRKLPSCDLRRHTGLPFETRERLRRRLGIAAPPVRPQRWSPETVKRLGREPDRRIARDLGITPVAVRRKREHLGIAFPQPGRRWTPEETDLLGTAPEAEIARRPGRTCQAVRSRRSRPGIPRFGSRTSGASGGSRRSARSGARPPRFPAFQAAGRSSSRADSR